MVNGYPDGTFKPDNTINLAEMLKYISNQLRKPRNCFYTKESNLFNDTPLDSYKIHSMPEKRNNKHHSNNTINPNRINTRISLQIFTAWNVKQGYFRKPAGTREEKMTAQHIQPHKTLPGGTIVEVTDLQTENSAG